MAPRAAPGPNDFGAVPARLREVLLPLELAELTARGAEHRGPQGPDRATSPDRRN